MKLLRSIVETASFSCLHLVPWFFAAAEPKIVSSKPGVSVFVVYGVFVQGARFCCVYICFFFSFVWCFFSSLSASVFRFCVCQCIASHIALR